MEERFKAYLKERHLVNEADRVLLAVSGGVDSMVMLELFRQCFPSSHFGVAHCNFRLRGSESDGDEALVRNYCKQHDIPILVETFDTQAEAQAYNESIQMAARRLRYDWFETLCRTAGYTKVAIAHQGDDSVETFFINLMRGTGLRGLTGIRVSRQRIIRPLLFATRDEITAYAAQEGVPFRNDSTNESVKYLRNRLRHEIIPQFSSSSNDFLATMEGNLTRLQEAQHFIDRQIGEIREKALVAETEERIILDLECLSAETLSFELHELLYPFGFPAEVLEDMARVITEAGTVSGKQFPAPAWTATLDRDRILLCRNQTPNFRDESLAANDPRVEWLTPEQLPASLETPPHIAYFGADALQFPLHLRRWKEGDWFIPLGMSGQKKVSDYLIDVKIPLVDKQRQGVLLSGDTLVWLVGQRIDDRYKVTSQARKIVKITL